MNAKYLLVGMLILGVFCLFGCAKEPATTGQGVFVSFFNESEGANQTQRPPVLVIEEPKPTEVAPEKPTSPAKPEPATTIPPSAQGIPVRRVVEGEVVELKVSATDPDGDKLQITYSPPLNESGKWQTKEGDAGQYKVTVTVSDGLASVSSEILIIVDPKNRPPVIEIESEIIVKEGDKIKLEPKVSDPDKDEVKVSFTGWMDSAEYTTGYKDAGAYIVTIVASDGKTSVAKDVKIVVLNVNRPPVIGTLQPIVATEGELVKVTPVVSDPDDDKLTITYSEPLNENGEWRTEEGDAGTYEFTVTVSDGTETVKASSRIVVNPLNRPPVIQRIPEIVVKEGEKVKIEPVVMDPDGDNFSISFSGWMKSGEYTTTYNDAGSYIVTVTAKDTKGASSSIDVRVTVIDVNRPPQIVVE